MNIEFGNIFLYIWHIFYIFIPFVLSLPVCVSVMVPWLMLLGWALASSKGHGYLGGLASLVGSRLLPGGQSRDLGLEAYYFRAPTP